MSRTTSPARPCAAPLACPLRAAPIQPLGARLEVLELLSHSAVLLRQPRILLGMLRRRRRVPVGGGNRGGRRAGGMTPAA